MAGVEQGNISNEELMEEITQYECVYHRSKDFKDKNKKANCWRKNRGEIYFFGSTGGGFEDGFKADDDVALRTNRRKTFACSKISSLTSAILFAAIAVHCTCVILILLLTEMFTTVSFAII